MGFLMFPDGYQIRKDIVGNHVNPFKRIALMYHITLSKEIKQNCPEFRGAAVFAEVTNTPYCEGLWQEIATFTQELRARETTDSIKYQPVIAATREAYKRCGKDPSLVSQNFTWEKVGTINVGLDVNLFNNRLSGVFEWYQRNT